jgi:hypothetical protein
VPRHVGHSGFTPPHVIVFVVFALNPPQRPDRQKASILSVGQQPLHNAIDAVMTGFATFATDRGHAFALLAAIRFVLRVALIGPARAG